MGELGSQDSGFGFNSYAAPDPASFKEECLSAAEDASRHVLNCIHPTLDSEEERRDIIDYMQRLIKSHVNCEVFPYGSVPLKTYLPDGDIDLTVTNGTRTDESMARDVLALLQREEKNVNAEFKVKNIQYIDAEVKILKFLVGDTVLDISFNQLGGLSTLCFLEQVDRLIGRNHLFKRSIILIKAWCYYESRILGAHHGLISTYALETLVLYIFHLYHSSLWGPLVVLYRFLEYYGKFDWENYCISLKGPVCKSSLPDIVVEVPENGSTDLMFGEEFLENCLDMFSVSLRELEGKPKAFQPKHLNIIDTLKENNNLGRSVHIGNFYRIRTAFKYGARRLSQVLSLPVDKVVDGIHKFFSNAIAWHGNDNKNFIQDFALEFGHEESSTASLSSPANLMSEENMLLRLSINDIDPVETEFPLKMASESWYPPEFNFREPISFRSKAGNSTSQEYGSKSWLEDQREHGEVNYRYKWSMDSSCVNLSSHASNDYNVDDMSLDYKDVDTTSVGESEAVNALADLTGDYDSHIRSLLYGQLCLGFSLSALAYHPSAIPSWANNRKPWEIVYQSMPLWWSQVSQMTLQPVLTEQSNCWAAYSAPPAYGSFSEAQIARGSGPYFPVMNGFHGMRYPQPQGESRNRVSDFPDQFHRHGQSVGVSNASAVNKTEHSRSGQIDGVHIASAVQNDEHSSREALPEKGETEDQNGLTDQMEGDSSGPLRIEFGSVGDLAERVISGSANHETEQRLEEQSFQLKSEAEFPPLC
ncbi:hypothetical protein SASPL_120262 [Salvia splendens]|uniref:Uncharacterized protein n=1 Tax=Salvia splendens TaxID=180675 RepID=A0A8X8ZV37_SALSN|nr:uncharacterized protein LOC121811227 [Salvia splendens]KAG6418063.1 hypothetical protein SASPL_120262 [Salvia splendens]